MSSLIINFPDCAEINPEGRGTPDSQVTVTAQKCTPEQLGPPPMFGSWEIAAFIIVGVAMAVGATFVRYRAHETKPKRLEQKRLAEKDKLDAKVAIAQAHKKCATCGDVYEPEGIK